VTAPGAVLALDQGTSATKALVLRADGSVAAEEQVRISSRAVGDGGVEADPSELWESLLLAGRRALAQVDEPLRAVALANQGETVLAWQREGSEAVSPAISWQDRRAAGICESLREHAEDVRASTGLELDPYFSAPKMAWLRERVGRGPVITTTDTFLLHRLCGAYVTDAATASRTLLYDLGRGEWSPALCDLFAVDRSSLPEIVANTDVVGSTRLFGPRVPVVGIAVDQQAALFAEGCLEAGDAKCTYGTGAFLLATVGETPVRSSHRLATSVAWRIGGRTTYCLDGQVYSAGTAISWLERIGLTPSADALDRLAGEAVCDGELFVPALSGLAAPFWVPEARALLAGVSLRTTAASTVAAVLDGIASNVSVLGEAIAGDLGAPLRRLRADGGLARSTFLMQRQAELLQAPVEVYATPHATALGVAALARLGLGEASDERDAVSSLAPAAVYRPSGPAADAAAHLRRWRIAAESAAAIR
jgi:glycerol kinase